MKKYFNNYFHLVYETDLSDYSFLVNGFECDVPCIFQIWEYKDNIRPIIEKQHPINFKFVKKEDNPDISFRRVGC
jgi:adenine specific DNA methylase Mod